MNGATRDNIAQPIWEGLFGEDTEGPFLLGGRCGACNFVTLGVRDICPECWTRGSMTMVPIGRRGRVYTATVVHQVPQGYDGPFAVGYVDVENGVRVFAHVGREPSALKPGTKVRLTVAPMRNDKDGTSLIGPLYVTE
jgi:uncharacterized OB-fold protein